MLAACLWVGYSLMGQVFGEHHEIKEYDPYEVLGIERGSTDRQIKRAYRQLSLKYHPDKNPDDKEAEETFVKIARAYAALTDEVARANYEKYGNPDGRQSLQVAIGLPSWLLDKGTQELLLLFYLVVLVVAIPLGVWTWYRWSSKYGETAVLLETQQYIGRTLANKQGAAIHARDLAELISTAPEFRKDTPRRPDAEFTRIKRSLESVPGYKMKLKCVTPVHAPRARSSWALSLFVQLGLPYSPLCVSLDATIFLTQPLEPSGVAALPSHWCLYTLSPPPCLHCTTRAFAWVCGRVPCPCCSRFVHLT